MKYHTKAISTFHQINAFEEDGFVILDMCCSDDGQAINNYLIQNLRKSGEALDEVSLHTHNHMLFTCLLKIRGLGVVLFVTFFSRFAPR